MGQTPSSSSDIRKIKPPPSPQLPLPLLLGERYRLIASCGGGGMAQVFRAIDERLQREVAVKVINPALRAESEFDARFQREVSILSNLSDPHIIVAHDTAIDPTYGPYLVMEYLRGMSLREKMRQGKLSVAAAMQVGAQVLLALQHAHDKGIVHRDIKPDNLFLVQQPGSLILVRVLDFGIARIYRDDTPQKSTHLRITLPGSIIGTPKYMAPEQVTGEKVEAKADLYSLAVVLFEALTGELPKIPFGPPLRQLCPEAPASLEAILNECLRIDPNQRPASAIVVFERLRQLRDSQGTPLIDSVSTHVMPALPPENSGEIPTHQTSLFQKVKRRGVILSIAMLALIAAAGWTGYQMFHLTGPVPSPERESLVGIEIGNFRPRVIERLGEPETEFKGDPFHSPVKEHIGHLVGPDDLQLPIETHECRILFWPKQGVCVLMVDEKVKAVVARQPATAVSGRNVHIGDKDLTLERCYPEQPEMPWGSSPKWGVVYHYPKHGIGFELESHLVTAIALFPSK